MEFVALAAGFALLATGGEYLVRSAVELSSRLGVPPLLIGFTIVAAATSAPEFIVGVQAALAGTPTIVLGNVVGANVANLGLGLGAMALARPFTAGRGSLGSDLRALLLAIVAFTGLGLTIGLTRWAAIVAVVALALHLWRSYRRELRRADAIRLAEVEAACAETGSGCWSVQRSVLTLLASVVALAVGAHWLLEAAVYLARFWGVSDTVVGASVVALGTTLPETATATVAALRRRPDVALGNLVGSCLFNLLGILGATVAIEPFMPARQFVVFGGASMFAFTLFAAPLLTGRMRASRSAGLVLLGGYVVFILLLTRFVSTA